MSINEYWLGRVAELEAQRDELLAALEETIEMARSLSHIQNEHIDETVDSFIAGDIEQLIARTKGGVA